MQNLYKSLFITNATSPQKISKNIATSSNNEAITQSNESTRTRQLVHNKTSAYL